MAAIAVGALFLAACGRGQALTLEKTWDVIVKAGKAHDCRELGLYMSDRLEFTQQDCDEVTAMFTKAVPELDWSLTDYSRGETKAIVYFKAKDPVKGTAIDFSDFVQNEQNVWQSDSVFWR